MSERHQILNDQEFWSRLEYEASRGLANSADQALTQFWIDGFLPEAISDTKSGADVEGIVWVGEGPRIQHQYRFVVSVPQKMLHRRRKSFSIDRFDLDAEQQVLQIAVVSRATDERRAAGDNRRDVQSSTL